MVYYSVSKDFEEIYLHFDSAPDSITVWRLKDNGWEWDNKGKRWQNKYCKATRRYARELSGSNVPTFVIPKGCYYGIWCDSIRWELYSSGHMVVWGQGELPAYNYDQIEDLPWYKIRNKIIGITVENGITSIGKRNFYNLPNLKWVRLRDSVSVIGERAFSRCCTLNRIQLSRNLTTIGFRAFQDCTSLTEIRIPESVQNIGTECFKNWTPQQKIFRMVKDKGGTQSKEILYSPSQIEGKSVSDIYFEDFVVITDNSHCVNNNHAFEDIRARINILQRNGDLRTITIPAGHCKTCNQYYIRISQFENLRNIGVILCRMVHEKYVSSKRSGNFYDTLSHESWLKQYGYSTNSKSNLTDVQRRQILVCLMESDPSSRQRIVNHLNWLIQQHKNQVNMLSAVAKWTSDRVFVENYKIGSTRVVAMKSLKIRHYANK